MDTQAQPTAKTYPPLKIAFCAEGDTAFTWWTPLLLQSPAFKVVAVWSRRKAEALRLHAAVTQRPCPEAADAGGTAGGRAQAAGGAAAGTDAAAATAANGVAGEEGAAAATPAAARGSGGEGARGPEGEAAATPTRAATTAAGAAIEQRRGEEEAAAAEVEVYWEEAGDLSDICSKRGKRSACKNFSTLLLQHSARVEGFFLVLPPDSHAATAEQVLSHLPDKHIFSATPPSLHSSTVKNLICLYTHNKEARRAEQQKRLDAAVTQKALGSNNSNNSSIKNSSRNSSSRVGNSSNRTTSGASKTCNSNNSGSRRRGLWSVCCPFRNEVAVTKLQALMKDLGKLVTAELLASATVQTVAHTYTGALPQRHLQLPLQEQRASVLAVCCAYSSLLRLILGDIVSLASVQGSTASTVSGQVQFQGGVSCAITVDLASKVTLFSLTVWGVKGYGKLCWNQERNAFEIQRYLHHYEHPTLHPVTGPLWAVKTWIENVWRQERREKQLRLPEEANCEKGGREGTDDRTEKEREVEEKDGEDVQAPERYLVDLLTSCALTGASGAVVQLRPVQHSWTRDSNHIN